MIGFKESEVQVPENIKDGVKLLCLAVLNGTLMHTTIVSVTYQNRSAISKYKTEEEFVDWLMDLIIIIYLIAIDGQDYISSLGIFTLSQAVTRACFNISILDDEIVEEEENFLVTITTGDPQINLSPSSTKLIIVDNDCLEGTVFKECGSSCPPSCDDRSPTCTKQCVIGKYYVIQWMKRKIVITLLTIKEAPFYRHS